jgi:tripartite-type tricarboxylate transporter receptor subunit TctC
MKTMIRHAACGAAMLLAAFAPAAAEDWPARNITVVIPLPAGVASDTMARIVLEQVGRQVGQAFVIENRPGAGGTIGANMVAKAAPDGYTMLVYGALAAANALYAKLPFDTGADFVPVVTFGQQPLAVIAAPAHFKNLGDLITRAKAKPGALNYSTAGVGSSSHFGAERLIVSAGIQVQHIPFKSGESLTEIVAGRIDFSVPPLTTAISLIRDGKLVVLAVGAKSRASLLPDAPTMIEAGLGADAIYPFYSPVFVPAKTPRAIVDRLHDEVAKALAVPSVQERLAKVGVEPMPMSVDELGMFFKDDVASNLSLVKAANIPRQ